MSSDRAIAALPMPADPAEPPRGKRQANKLDKLERIKRVARELFTLHGYDEATTRQIALRADVALGTVFTYASNKRDLLFLVANDMLDEARAKGEASFRDDRSLIENFIVFCAIDFKAMGAEPELSRLILRELLFYDSGVQALRARENRDLLLGNLEHMVVRAHEKGEIRLTAPASFVAWVLFSLKQAEIRRWLGQERQDLSEGMRHLWAAAALVVNGMAVEPVPAQAHPARLRKLLAPL